ncbi:MAG TPA: sigma-70 family RNA polymerase sigma factor [Sedimentisphaerales bacterium]|nr:sigma-70 family RNA polymerase sigma factor [Sedimentisphaerales bacterium]
MKKAAELIEQLLLLRCQIGDKDAFAELIERYERPLRYFINRLLDNSKLTEDIFQDTWLTVIRRIHGLREIDAFPAWLYRIARNKVYQQLRKKRNVSRLDENIAVVDHAEEDDFSAEDAAKVHKCLKEISPEYREVLMLRFLEQMSYQQIAQVLNCKLGTVRSRIYYAKIALKKELEK